MSDLERLSLFKEDKCGSWRCSSPLGSRWCICLISGFNAFFYFFKTFLGFYGGFFRSPKITVNCVYLWVSSRKLGFVSPLSGSNVKCGLDKPASKIADVKRQRRTATKPTSFLEQTMVKTILFYYSLDTNNYDYGKTMISSLSLSLSLRFVNITFKIPCSDGINSRE